VRPKPIDNPPNRFESTAVAWDDGDEPRATQPVRVYEDGTKTILASNDSPDVGFSWSVNPYRGCQHACAYCYARPSHEYLGFGAGTDFDTQIVVKPQAPALLRAAFDKPSWKGELVVFSGVTDCYQPLEQTWRLTRGCLEVCADYRNPVGIITKAPLIERDLDVLVELSRVTRLTVSISIPFWDKDNARAIEPTVATPQRRLRTVETLAKAGIEVGVNVAPIIPGLNDKDIPSVLEAAAAAGAKRAAMIIVRLPGAVHDVFMPRLERELPLRAEHVLHRIRDVRNGKPNDARYGSRMSGEGEYAAAIEALFDTHARRLGLRESWGHEDAPVPSPFRRPARGPQLSLFPV
jgi:DNA repair photolyase